MPTQLKKLYKGSNVTLRGSVPRRGIVRKLFDTGYYAVEWTEAFDTEGQRCIAAKELRQHRREELCLLDERGRYDDVQTIEAAAVESDAVGPNEVALDEAPAPRKAKPSPVEEFDAPPATPPVVTEPKAV